MMKTTLQRLSDWYATQCDGDWEHGYGFSITTLDNPGVSVTINLNGTELKEATYPETNQSYETENDWMICRKSEGTFEGRGAPGRLEDILLAFLNWAESHEKA